MISALSIPRRYTLMMPRLSDPANRRIPAHGSSGPAPSHGARAPRRRNRQRRANAAPMARCAPCGVGGAAPGDGSLSGTVGCPPGSGPWPTRVGDRYVRRRGSGGCYLRRGLRPPIRLRRGDGDRRWRGRVLSLLPSISPSSSVPASSMRPARDVRCASPSAATASIRPRARWRRPSQGGTSA
jgi:hypothetical protein